MKIAVTYQNGEVFQHFGKTEHFMIYEFDGNAIVSCELLDSNGSGHSALAALLAENGVNVVICGGLGDGAQSSLTEAGIEICSGASGDADAAVIDFLNGELFSTGVNCDHHEEDHECCGGDCGDGCSCGGGCGGGCGGCGGELRLTMEGKNAGKTCKVHYRGTFNDGTQFDSSYDRGEPLEFVCAAGMMIRGFDAAVVNMEVGESADIHLMPEEAYGLADPNAIFTVPIAQIPGSEDLVVNQKVYLADQMGRPFPVTVTAKDDVTITFDANHEMAGKELNFHIELLSAE